MERSALLVCGILQLVAGESVLTDGAASTLGVDSLSSVVYMPTQASVWNEMPPSDQVARTAVDLTPSPTLHDVQQTSGVLEAMTSDYQDVGLRTEQFSLSAVDNPPTSTAPSLSATAEGATSTTTPMSKMATDSLDGTTVEVTFQSAEGTSYTSASTIDSTIFYLATSSSALDLGSIQLSDHFVATHQPDEVSTLRLSTDVPTVVPSSFSSWSPEVSTSPLPFQAPDSDVFSIISPTVSSSSSLGTEIQPTSVVVPESTTPSGYPNSEMFFSSSDVVPSTTAMPIVNVTYTPDPDSSLNASLYVVDTLKSGSTLETWNSLEAASLDSRSANDFTIFPSTVEVVVAASETFQINTVPVTTFTPSVPVVTESYLTGISTSLVPSSIDADPVYVSTAVSFSLTPADQTITDGSTDTNVSVTEPARTDTASYVTDQFATQSITTFVPTAPSATEVPSAGSEDIRVRFVLSGNCSILARMDAADRLADFRVQMRRALAELLDLDQSQIRIQDAQCGSIVVAAILINVTRRADVRSRLDAAADTDLFSASAGNDTFSFSLVSSAFVSGRGSWPAEDGDASPSGFQLTDVHVIIIIVCSIVGGMLLLYAFGFCAHACYQRKKTKSFDLGETPVCDLSMDDFTLTKMQRPQLIYSEYGPVVQPSRPNGKSKRRNGHYLPVDDEIQCLSAEDIHLASTLPRRPSTELTADRRAAGGDAHGSPVQGFENPSFSSDDILDSGPDTDQELPADPAPRQTTTDKTQDVIFKGTNSNGHVVGEGATSF